MKNQALFSSKDKSKKLKCRLLQFLFGALRVEVYHTVVVGGEFFYLFIKRPFETVFQSIPGRLPERGSKDKKKEMID